MSSIGIYVSSRDNVSSSNNSFKVYLNTYFGRGTDGFSLALTHLYFINSNYVIHSYNRYVYFVYNGTAYTATLHTRNYTSSEMVTELQTEMNDAVPGTPFTVTYNSTTDRLAISSSGSTFRFATGTNNAYSVLGVTSTNLTSTAASSVTLGGILDLSGTKYVDIATNMSANSFSSSGRRVFERIPITAAYGSMAYWENQYPRYQYYFADSLTTLDIELFDDHGYPLQLAENSYVFMHFMLVPGDSE